jgi:hypothetical protein
MHFGDLDLRFLDWVEGGGVDGVVDRGVRFGGRIGAVESGVVDWAGGANGVTAGLAKNCSCGEESGGRLTSGGWKGFVLLGLEIEFIFERFDRGVPGRLVSASRWVGGSTNSQVDGLPVSRQLECNWAITGALIWALGS